MIQIDKETQERRNAEYNKIARKYPAYLSLAIPIILGVAMGVKDIAGTGHTAGVRSKHCSSRKAGSGL